jgi:hypothetical protein
MDIIKSMKKILKVTENKFSLNISLSFEKRTY